MYLYANWHFSGLCVDYFLTPCTLIFRASSFYLRALTLRRRCVVFSWSHAIL